MLLVTVLIQKSRGPLPKSFLTLAMNRGEMLLYAPSGGHAEHRVPGRPEDPR